ncbi:multi-pass transmembrane [Cryptosporidium sp. chipmunk genotype I]|uniref:multi-pass transmembrane n=1 Tax=Cryptosporidium sp. chipmunk genotype I TaxID=1280935 RepID=UPI00351A27D7|nr:multi-pass transmembrane [Cryptosporidium sp. chipmunk genotype I]
MKITNFFQYYIELLLFFTALFSELDAYSGSFTELEDFGSRRYKVTTETFDVYTNTFYSKVNEKFNECINWYSVVFSSISFGPLITPSLPDGLFVFFSKKKTSKCNINEKIKEHFLSIPNINLGFDTSVVNKFTKLYSKEEISYELNKLNKEIYLDILSKSNPFTPNHPEFFSLEGEELAYIHFPQLEIENQILKELLLGLFELNSISSTTISLLRLSVRGHTKNKWKTRVTSLSIDESSSKEHCKYGDLEVVRKLNGSGFHWNLETEIINFKNTPILLDSFNREIFVDIDEIYQMNERNADGISLPLHSVHIERPSEESDGVLLLSIGKSSSVPIHARYQSACNGCNFKTAVIGFPSIVIYLKEPGANYCLIPKLRFEIAPNRNVKIGSSQKEIIINIPVGNSKDINYVFIATIFTIIITTVTTGVSIKRY